MTVLSALSVIQFQTYVGAVYLENYYKIIIRIIKLHQFHQFTVEFVVRDFIYHGDAKLLVKTPFNF